MTNNHAQRLALYKQGLTDKEIADIEGVPRERICFWRYTRKLPVNKRVSKGEVETYNYRCPMEHALSPDQRRVIRQFFADLLRAADRCPGKKDVGGFMHTWHDLAKEGKVAG